MSSKFGTLHPKEDIKRIWLVFIIVIVLFYFVSKLNYYTITPLQKAEFKIFLWMIVMFFSYFIRKLIAPYVETGKALTSVHDKNLRDIVRLAYAIVYAADLFYYIGLAAIGGLVVAFAF